MNCLIVIAVIFIASASTLPTQKDNGNKTTNSKIIGSRVVTSVSVVTNGKEPTFTDSIGRPVPRPQVPPQVASPINLLNPDRYEFYTFNEKGELVKRVMTKEEISSIVAGGDGEGSMYFNHLSPNFAESEQNVDDILNVVQNVLNKEIAQKQNSTNKNPMLDTPDTSSSWSSILPTIFGNTGGDISPNKPQQVVMTPDSIIMEATIKSTSTTKLATPSTTEKTVEKPVNQTIPTKTPVTTTTIKVEQKINEHEDYPIDFKNVQDNGMLQDENFEITQKITTTSTSSKLTSTSPTKPTTLVPTFSISNKTSTSTTNLVTTTTDSVPTSTITATERSTTTTSTTRTSTTAATTTVTTTTTTPKPTTTTKPSTTTTTTTTSSTDTTPTSTTSTTTTQKPTTTTSTPISSTTTTITSPPTTTSSVTTTTPVTSTSKTTKRPQATSTSNTKITSVLTTTKTPTTTTTLTTTPLTTSISTTTTTTTTSPTTTVSTTPIPTSKASTTTTPEKEATSTLAPLTTVITTSTTMTTPSNQSTSESQNVLPPKINGENFKNESPMILISQSAATDEDNSENESNSIYQIIESLQNETPNNENTEMILSNADKLNLLTYTDGDESNSVVTIQPIKPNKTEENISNVYKNEPLYAEEVDPILIDIPTTIKPVVDLNDSQIQVPTSEKLVGMDQVLTSTFSPNQAVVQKVEDMIANHQDINPDISIASSSILMEAPVIRKNFTMADYQEQTATVASNIISKQKPVNKIVSVQPADDTMLSESLTNLISQVSDNAVTVIPILDTKVDNFEDPFTKFEAVSIIVPSVTQSPFEDLVKSTTKMEPEIKYETSIVKETSSVSIEQANVNKTKLNEPVSTEVSVKADVHTAVNKIEDPPLPEIGTESTINIPSDILGIIGSLDEDNFKSNTTSLVAENKDEEYYENESTDTDSVITTPVSFAVKDKEQQAENVVEKENDFKEKEQEEDKLVTTTTIDELESDMELVEQFVDGMTSDLETVNESIEDDFQPENTEITTTETDQNESESVETFTLVNVSDKIHEPQSTRQPEITTNSIKEITVDTIPTTELPLSIVDENESEKVTTFEKTEINLGATTVEPAVNNNDDLTTVSSTTKEKPTTEWDYDEESATPELLPQTTTEMPITTIEPEDNTTVKHTINPVLVPSKPQILQSNLQRKEDSTEILDPIITTSPQITRDEASEYVFVRLGETTISSKSSTESTPIKETTTIPTTSQVNIPTISYKKPIYSTHLYNKKTVAPPLKYNNPSLSPELTRKPMPVELNPAPTESLGLEESTTNLSEDLQNFVKLCNELAFTFWRATTFNTGIRSDRTVVISPYAMTSLLSMVFLGTRGRTSGEMNELLKLDDMTTFNPHLVFRNITDSAMMNLKSSGVSTSVFVRELLSDRAKGKLLQFYKDKAQQFYSGHVEEASYSMINDIIRRRTNILVKRNTQNRINEFLKTNSIWLNPPLSGVSVNLFYTDCNTAIVNERDGEMFFQVSPAVRQRRLVPIPAVVYRTGFTAGYDSNLDATIIAFGSPTTTVSTIYIMPGQQGHIVPGDSLERLETNLVETAFTKNSWHRLLTTLLEREGLEVQIPRFSHRSYINATVGLQKMGLKDLFDSEKADLRGLTGTTTRDLHFSDMMQINEFVTCGEEKVNDQHHIEQYPLQPNRERSLYYNDPSQEVDEDLLERYKRKLVEPQDYQRSFYDPLYDPSLLDVPLPLRPRQARLPETPRLRFDRPFMFFVRHNPTGMILHMGRFNPRLLP